jgi:hypothetical protein
MKRKHAMIDTYASVVTEKSQDVCGVNLNMNGVAIGSTIRDAYEIIVSMTILNIFARIRYLSSFFEVWTLEIVPTFDNMVSKVIDYNGIAMNTCLYARREAAFQFYNVNNRIDFPYLANGDGFHHWIQFQTGNYQIRHAEFYSARFNLLRDPCKKSTKKTAKVEYNMDLYLSNLDSQT